MPASYADNAVLAKVRAMYGKRLTAGDYEQLLTKKTVGEVAGYLKAETVYGAGLTEVREELIHREQLENLIRRRSLDVYSKLRKYAGRDALFLRLYVMESETTQLLTAIRLLNAGQMDRFIVQLPVHLAKLLSFDLFAVAGAQTFDDLLAIVERSGYYFILAPHRPATSGKSVDIAACEAALLTGYYKAALALVDSRYRGEIRTELRRLLLHQVNLHNVSVIYRLRRFRGADKEQIAPLMVRVEGMDRRLVQRLLDAADMDATAEILRGSKRRAAILDPEQDSRSQTGQALRLRRQMNQRVFRFSTNPMVAVICYMVLLDIEQANIVHIVEGIRYGLPPDQIRELLAV